MLALDRLDLKDIKVLRERSLHKMKKMVEKRRQGVALGYGEYMEIYVLKVFFSVVKASDRVVCQFYCENWPFKTVITGNHSTADGLATFNSAIFAVVGQGFVAVNNIPEHSRGSKSPGSCNANSDTVYILQVMKERANNRVDDLQGMFCDLKLARKESRTNDVALLEEQVNQMLGEWQSVLNHPSPASSF
ncbi:hypothetical protein AgCh_000860 [Apium graveolens]